jgi:hypothetical protein
MHCRLECRAAAARASVKQYTQISGGKILLTDLEKILQRHQQQHGLMVIEAERAETSCQGMG